MRKEKVWVTLLGILMVTLSGSTGHAAVSQIDALLSTGYYINFENSAPIKLVSDAGSPDPFHTYRGCMESFVISNFDAHLIASVRPTSAAAGDWKVRLTPHTIPTGRTTVSLCVSGHNVLIERLPGGRSDLKVAEIIIEVAPR